MNETFLVEQPDGTLVYKTAEELRPDDLVLFDHPDAFSDLLSAHRRRLEEIHLEEQSLSWRSLRRRAETR